MDIGFDYINLLLLASSFFIVYFFIIRPQKNKQAQQKSYVDSLKRGDKVIMISGLCGTVSSITDTKIFVEVDDHGHKVEFLRGGISIDETRKLNAK